MASNPTYLSRRQVAALLGVDEADVKSRDNATFHPVKVADGSWRYPPEEVAAVLRGLVADDGTGELSGAVCAEVFQQFKASKPMADVVIAVRQPPAVVRTLKVEYDSMTESLTISKDTLHAMEKVLGTVPKDESKLTELVNLLAERCHQEYRRGYADGAAEAGDMGEIVDPSSGKTRPVAAHDIATAAKVVEERWAGGPSTTASRNTGSQ